MLQTFVLISPNSNIFCGHREIVFGFIKMWGEKINVLYKNFEIPRNKKYNLEWGASKSSQITANRNKQRIVYVYCAILQSIKNSVERAKLFTNTLDQKKKWCEMLSRYNRHISWPFCGLCGYHFIQPHFKRVELILWKCFIKMNSPGTECMCMFERNVLGRKNTLCYTCSVFVHSNFAECFSFGDIQFFNPFSLNSFMNKIARKT